MKKKAEKHSKSEELRSQQQKRGTDAFPPTFAQVFANLGDGGDVRDGILPELHFDGQQVIVQELENFLPVNG